MKKNILIFCLILFSQQLLAQNPYPVRSCGNQQYMWRHTMWKTHSGKKDDWLKFQNKRLVPVLVTYYRSDEKYLM